MSTWLLLLGVVGAVSVLNAWYPTRLSLLLAGSFFASWLTIELAPWWLFWNAVLTAVLVAGGALDSAAGWAGLGLEVATMAGLVAIIIRARRTVLTVGEIVRDLDVDGDTPRFPRSHVWVPFLMRHRRGVEVIKNVEFAHVDGVRLRLDIARPAEPGTKRPGLLQVHGGAWVIGDKKQQGIPLCNHLAANGWVTINANYRLSSMNRRKRPGNPFPVHLQDVKRAIAWYREHAEEYGADPSFLCVTGGSAGGHLTALVGLTANDPEYQPGFESVDTSVCAAVPFYGVYDFTNRSGAWHKDTVRRFIEPIVMRTRYADDPDAFHRASPLDRVHPDAPPFLIVHGSRDTLAPVDDARTFAARLEEISQSPVLYAEMQGAQHAFEIFPSFRAARVIEGVERYLASVHRAYRKGRTDEEVTEHEVAEPLVDAN